jgi:hypothetical protein
MRRRVWGVVLALTMVSTCSASADPRPTDKETARELFNQGKEARAAGDLAQALEKFTAAHQLVATPITALELARTHAALLHLVIARDIALSVARIPPPATESERAKEARIAAARLAESIYTRIATLTVVVDVTPPGQQAILKLDGVEISTLTATDGYRLDPGAHTLTGQVGAGPVTSAQIDLAEGERRSVELNVVAPAPPPPVPPASASPTHAVSEKSKSPLLWVGLASAGVGAGVGTVAGILALGKASTTSCHDTLCTPGGRSDISDGRTFATVSTIAFGVALAGAALAAYGFFAKPHRAVVSGSRLRVELGFESAGGP